MLGNGPGRRSKMGDVSLTPVGCLPQQAQDFLVWTGWASGLPLAPCAGQAAPPLQRSSHVHRTGRWTRPGCCEVQGADAMAWCLPDTQQSTDSAVSRPSLPPQSWAGPLSVQAAGPAA